MTPADQSLVRQMIQQEVMKANQMAKFNLNVTPNHAHTGKGGDAPRISQNDVIPGIRAEGSIVMSTQTVYKIGISFNPSAIYVHGNVTGPNNEVFIVVGNAQLGGTSYYMQPQSTTSVVLGGPAQNIIQSTTYFGADSLGALHTLVDEGHIVDIYYKVSGVKTLLVRGTITDYSATAITVSFVGGTNILTAGWTVNLSWTVT